ncbi:MAG: class IV adenylate cyclase [Ferruginibacter sp.]
MHINFEFKARTQDHEAIKNVLLQQNARFAGEDNQTDIYFNVATGRLKLRQGNIENALIYYERENTNEPKQSNVMLYQHPADDTLLAILKKVHGVKCVVKKKRRIYFIDNVKFHLDEVEQLGTFVEVEAIDETGSLGLQKITGQCLHYVALLKILPEDYVQLSYSDMILQLF